MPSMRTGRPDRDGQGRRGIESLRYSLTPPVKHLRITIFLGIWLSGICPRSARRETRDCRKIQRGSQLIQSNREPCFQTFLPFSFLAMPLNETPEEVQWDEADLLFVERVGEFSETAPACWGIMHDKLEAIKAAFQVQAVCSTYRLSPEKVYRAGVRVSGPVDASAIPEGISLEKHAGGKFLRFTLTGPFAQLPEACGRVSELVGEMKPDLRDDYYVEHYETDPKVTPEDQLITQIMVPIA